MEESIVVVGYFKHQVYTFGLACAFVYPLIMQFNSLLLSLSVDIFLSIV